MDNTQCWLLTKKFKVCRNRAIHGQVCGVHKNVMDRIIAEMDHEAFVKKYQLEKLENFKDVSLTDAQVAVT